MTTAPLLLGSAIFLHVQNILLAEKDKKLPLARHVVSALQRFHFIEHFIFIVFMGSEKVVVSNPERKVIARTFGCYQSRLCDGRKPYKCG